MKRLRRWLGARIARPIAIDRVLFALASLCIAVTVLIALLGILSSRNYVAHKLDAQDEISGCRNRIAARLADEQTNYLLDIGGAVFTPTGATSSEGLTRADYVLRAQTDGPALARARDLRVAFELSPAADSGHPCAIPPP